MILKILIIYFIYLNTDYYIYNYNLKLIKQRDQNIILYVNILNDFYYKNKNRIL